MNLLENFSHESVRKWYKKCKELFDVDSKLGEQLQWMKQRLSWKTTRFMSGMQLDADERSISAVHVSF